MAFIPPRGRGRAIKAPPPKKASKKSKKTNALTKSELIQKLYFYILKTFILHNIL